jgi:hemerythrin-like domain-containing protein
MDELTAEHVLARDYTKELVAAKENYLREEPEAVGKILFYLDKLTAIYPKHIATEDQHFFIPCMSYFTPGKGRHAGPDVGVRPADDP